MSRAGCSLVGCNGDFHRSVYQGSSKHKYGGGRAALAMARARFLRVAWTESHQVESCAAPCERRPGRVETSDRAGWFEDKGNPRTRATEEDSRRMYGMYVPVVCDAPALAAEAARLHVSHDNAELVRLAVCAATRMHTDEVWGGAYPLVAFSAVCLLCSL